MGETGFKAEKHGVEMSPQCNQNHNSAESRTSTQSNCPKAQETISQLQL